jgi:uncharacterized membrane protein
LGCAICHTVLHALSQLMAQVCSRPDELRHLKYAIGTIVDRDYRKTAQAAGFPIDRVRGDDLATFPIEKARLRSVFICVLVSVASTTGYGWSMQGGVHLSVPLIMLFLCALATTFVFNVSLTFPCSVQRIEKANHENRFAIL